MNSNSYGLNMGNLYLVMAARIRQFSKWTMIWTNSNVRSKYMRSHVLIEEISYFCEICKHMTWLECPTQVFSLNWQWRRISFALRLKIIRFCIIKFQNKIIHTSTNDLRPFTLVQVRVIPIIGTRHLISIKLLLH